MSSKCLNDELFEEKRESNLRLFVKQLFIEKFKETQTHAFTEIIINTFEESSDVCTFFIVYEIKFSSI